jgi:formylglycine-generating enzyme required for sulfatase activity
MKALEKRRNDRYSTVAELAAEVERHLNSEPLVTRPRSIVYPLRKYVRRNRAKIGVVALVSLAILSLPLSLWIGHVAHQRRQSREADRLLAAGRHELEEYTRLRGLVSGLELGLQHARQEHERGEPIWKYEPVLEIESRLPEQRRNMRAAHERSVYTLIQAARLAPDEARREAALRGLDEIRAETAEDDLPGWMIAGSAQVMELRSDPPGAEVFCYRFEEHEYRLLPLAYDATGARGTIGVPCLEVEAVEDPEKAHPFEEGDRILTLSGRPIRTRTELARAIDALEYGTPAKVEVRRTGKILDLDWIPFPASSGAEGPGEKPVMGRGFREQFGIRFAGCPLERLDACRVATTAAGGSASVALPGGSYLLVFRKPEYLEARVPVVVPSDHPLRTVRLFRRDRVPPGFLHIPAGFFSYGGDGKAFESLARGERDLEDFFMARLEVTVGEYLEFVNDLEVLAVTDKGRREDNTMGWARPFAKEVREYLLERDLGAKGEEDRIRLIPRFHKQWRWVPDKNRWETDWPSEWPVLHVTQLAALEYAAWRTRRARERGKSWRFRLPDDHEWEKAARGVDRRPFVWGDHFVWSFCWSLPVSDKPGGVPAPVGISPLDESVYGVRDLAGSVDEWTASYKETDSRFVSQRGGSWYTVDDYNFRVANRNGRFPHMSSRRNGIRLVVDLTEE